MGQASAWLSSAAAEVEAAAASVRVAIPEVWRGAAAQSFSGRAGFVSRTVLGASSRAADAAGLAHQHELEMAAMRAALANGGMVAV